MAATNDDILRELQNVTSALREDRSRRNDSDREPERKKDSGKEKTKALYQGDIQGQILDLMSSVPGLAKLADNLNLSREGFAALGEEAFRLRNKMDQARASFAQTTGMMDQAGKVYSMLGNSLKGLGMDYQESATHLASLVKEIPGFLDLSKEEIKSVGLLSAQFNRLGVDVGTFSKSFLFLQKTIGLPVPEIKKTQLELVGLARSLKMPPETILKDYVEAMPKLAQFGTMAPDIFRKAEGYAKTLGISMQTITNQIEKFDSFESAAEAAGNLNVLMRENLFDTQELLYANPAEKVKIFTRAMEEYKNKTGVGFSEMNVFLQRQMAQQSGFTVQELQNISKHTVAELEGIQDPTAVLSEGVEASMKKNVAATVTFENRMNNMRDSLANSFAPLLDKLQERFNNYSSVVTNQIQDIGLFWREHPELLKMAQQDVAGVIMGREAERYNIPQTLMSFDQAKYGVFGKTAVGLVQKANLMSIDLASAVGMESIENFTQAGEAAKTLFTRMFGMDEQGKSHLAGIMGEFKGMISGNLSSVMGDLGFGNMDINVATTAVSDMFNSMQSGGGQLFDYLKEKVLDFKGVYSDSMGALANDPNMNPFTKLGISLRDGLTQTVTAITADLNANGALGSQIVGAYNSLKTTVIDTVTGLFNGVAQIFQGFTTSPAWGQITSALGVIGTDLYNGATSILGPTFKAIGDFLGDALNKAFTGAFGMVGGLVASGITGSLGLAWDGVKGLGSGIWDSIMGQGANSGQGAVPALNNLKGVAATIPASLQNAGQSANQMNAAIAGLKPNDVQNYKVLSEAIDKYANALEKVNKYSAEQDKIKDVLEEMGKTIAGAFGDLNGTKIGEAMAGPITAEIKRSLGT